MGLSMKVNAGHQRLETAVFETLVPVSRLLTVTTPGIGRLRTAAPWTPSGP